MIASTPTQEQVDQIAKDLAPDVVRIRIRLGEDWTEHPAIYLRVILSDEACRPGRLSEVVRTVRGKFDDSFGLWESDRIPYFKFRSLSEQEKIKEAAWE